MTTPIPAGKTFTYTITATWWNNYRKSSAHALLNWPLQVVTSSTKHDPKHPDKFRDRYVPTPTTWWTCASSRSAQKTSSTI